MRDGKAVLVRRFALVLDAGTCSPQGRQWRREEGINERLQGQVSAYNGWLIPVLVFGTSDLDGMSWS